MGLQKFKKRWEDVAELEWAAWRPAIPPHCVENLFAFDEGGDTVPELLCFFNYYSFPNIYFLYV